VNNSVGEEVWKQSKVKIIYRSCYIFIRWVGA